MGAIATLGRAFIEVHADTSPFARQVRQAMRRLAQDMREDTDRAGNLIGQRLGLRARQGFTQSFGRRPLNVPIRTDLSAASVVATEAAVARVTRNRTINIRFNRRTLLRNIGLIVTAIGQFALALVRILGDLFSFGRQIGLIFGEAFRNLSGALGGSTKAAVGLGAALAQLAAASAALAVVILALAGVFGILVAAASALFQALLLIATLIPGLGAAALITIPPMILIFTNLGDAIKATAGSAEEFDAAVSGLGDNTFHVLSMLREMVQFFIRLREELQEDFFDPINETLQSFEATLGPTFAAGFSRVATAAGEIAASFIELFDHPQAERFFTDLFELAEIGIGSIGRAIVEFIESLGVLIDETFPELNRAAVGIGDVIRGWARSIEDFATDPNLRDTLREWEESFEVITELLGTAVDLAVTLMDEFRDDGIPVLESINGLMEDFIEFLESDAGEEFFDGMRVSAEGVVVAVGGIFSILAAMLQLIGAIDEAVSGDLTGSFQALQEGPVSLLFGLTGQIWETTLNWIGSVRELFRRFGVVNGILSLISGRLIDIRGTVQRIRDWLSRVRDRLNNIVGRGRVLNGVFGSIRSAVSRVSGAISTAGRRVSSAIGRARTLSRVFGTARNVVSGIAGAISNVIGRISSAVGWAQTLATTLGNIRVPSFGGFGGLFGQDGGIFTRPTNITIGEAGPEVLIPLTRPQRARELIAMSGLASAVRGGDGATASATLGVGGASSIRLVFQTDGTAASDAIMEVLRRSVRIRGGDVQTVLGSS